MSIRLTILGSGTSTGVPMIGCDCETCRSTDPRDNRMRASVLVECDGATLVIDTTPEFRLQMLRANVRRLDAVLLTHNHADHIYGLDDLRHFTFRMPDRRIPVYGSPPTLEWVRQHFDYIWNPVQRGGGVPKIDLCPVAEPFLVGAVRVVPVPVMHGILPVYGYRIRNLAYISDVSDIPESSWSLLDNLDVLIVDAVRYRPHSTHYHLAAAIKAAQRIGACRTWFTHLNHDFLHARLEAELPPGMAPAYDGLVVRSSEGLNRT